MFTRSLHQSFINPIDTSNTHDKVKCLEEHLSSDCKYNPFCLVSVSDEDNLRFASFLHQLGIRCIIRHWTDLVLI